MDRLNIAIADAVRNSPGYLLQELGLKTVMVLRPQALPMRSGEVALTELDDNIRSYGRGYILRPAPKENWAAIRIFDCHYGYRLWWVEFNCTSGVFSFGVTRNKCHRTFITPVASVEGASLRHYRRRDII